jgi:diguanylate cyclase (GGDEF)-like protein
MKYRQLQPFILLGILPALLASAILFGLSTVVGLAAYEADVATAERQRQLANTILSKVESGIAHDQESVTVWDDAIVKVTAGDQEWMENNVGKWMSTYFLHDAAHVLSPQDEPIHSFSSESGDPKAAFQEVRRVARPLAQKLRRRLAEGDETGVSGEVLSIGESDMAVVSGHLAIVSVKPIVSDTGNIEQQPGQEYLHVAVRYLDGNFLTRTASDYQFDDLQFSLNKPRSVERSVATVKNDKGDLSGYLSWRPFEPGAKAGKEITPAVLGAAAAVFAATSALGAAICVRTRRLAKSRSELEHLATHDALTGLSNRTHFNHTMMASHASISQPKAILLIDLDHFKQVNDTLGHPVGDKLLITVAGRLREIFPRSLTARLGGDEFAVVVDDTGNERLAFLCGQVVEALRTPFAIDGGVIKIGASVGAASGRDHPGDTANLIRQADVALYHAKGVGRNTYAIFGSHMEELIQDRRELERDLSLAAHSGDGLEVHFQPLYSGGDGAMTGAEALLRWQHPTRGAIGPDIFIPIAEETGLIVELGQFALKEACLAVKRWPDLRVAVNASPVELGSETYALHVVRILNQFNIGPDRIEIEITESALIDGEGHCRSNIDALRGAGVRFALDDFGTGFSSFGRLQEINVDRIKIDKSFIDNVGNRQQSQAIVEAMIALARAQGMQTTAEGVETEDQRVALSRLGCDTLQGFLMSRPLAKASFDSLLMKQGWRPGIAEVDRVINDPQEQACA